nr:hypothetical protein [Deltaproteobacteria bacterium]NIV44532.1 hypothetical protein [Candidatus Bathyarchaeota archaeon]
MKRLSLFLCVLSLVLGITATALAQLAEIEPNDSFSQAQDLGTGDVSISNLEINPSGDVDYFRWTAGNDGDASFQIFFTHAS